MTIVPILAVGANQKWKLDHRSIQNYGRIIGLHLDEIKDRNEMKTSIDSVTNLPSDTTASLQCIVNKPKWKLMLKTLIEKGFYA